jgi:TIR domain
MPQVFISYASHDAIFADLTKMKLHAASIQVWLDTGALHAGAEWRKAIDEVDRVFPCCLSRDYTSLMQISVRYL